jgi:hypothetical protein
MPLEIWLCAHEDLRASRRVRLLTDRGALRAAILGYGLVDAALDVGDPGAIIVEKIRQRPDDYPVGRSGDRAALDEPTTTMSLRPAESARRMT